MNESRGTVHAALRQWQNIALIPAVLGGIGLLASYNDGSADHKGFWSSYLFGMIFWLGITLGCCALTYLHHCIRSHWSLSILRIAEAGNKNLPLMAVVFAIVAIGVLFGKQVYPWADPEVYSHLHHNKQWWYAPAWWAARAMLYFGFWIITTGILNRSSARQDQSRDESLAHARASRAAPWGVFHVIFLTFAFTDWLMSLDPNWFSTLYGAWHLATQLLATYALGTWIVLTLRDRTPYSEVVTPALTKDLGNMMLGFTMVWGYFTLSQFLIIWSGNLPEEIPFFVKRFRGSAVFIGTFLVVGQFFGPFLCLIAGRTKRTFPLLRLVAGWIFCVRIIDVWWQVVPFLRHDPLQGGALLRDLAAFCGIGGIWLVLFLNNLRKSSVIPEHDPRLHEAKASLEAHGHA